MGRRGPDEDGTVWVCPICHEEYSAEVDADIDIHDFFAGGAS